MRRRFVVMALVLATAAALPAAAVTATVERVDDVSTVVAVAFPDDFPVGSLSRADCAFVQRVTLPDGSAEETQVCELSDVPVMIPEFQGTAPDRALVHHGGPCEWLSDFQFVRYGLDEYADGYLLVVTPAGRVTVTSTYPAAPLDCE
jgi:hypothetical protein